MDWEFAVDVSSAVSLNEARKLAELAQGKVALEVGSWFGRSSIAIASTSRFLHAIDWHRGEVGSGGPIDEWVYNPALDSLVGWRDNVRRYGVFDKIVLHLGTTPQVCPSMRHGFFDLCFIDAGHSFIDVIADLAQTSPLLRAEAVVALHDFIYEDLGVAAAARQWFGREPDEIVDSLAVYRA